MRLGERIQELFDEAQERAGHPNPPHPAREPVEVVDEVPPTGPDASEGGPSSA